MSYDTTARKGSHSPVRNDPAVQVNYAPRWARPTKAAAYLGTTPDVLSRWRYLRKGPAYIIPPGVRSVLYDLNDVDRWLAAGRVKTSGTVVAPGPERPPVRPPERPSDDNRAGDS